MSLYFKTLNSLKRDLPGSPGVNSLSCHVGDAGSIPGQGTEIPHATGQLNLHAATNSLHITTKLQHGQLNKQILKKKKLGRVQKDLGIPKPSFCNKNKIQFTNYTIILKAIKIASGFWYVSYHYRTNINIIALAFMQLHLW